MVALRLLMRNEELDAYTQECKALRESGKHYSQYVFGYLEPFFRQLRSEGKLAQDGNYRNFR